METLGLFFLYSDLFLSKSVVEIVRLYRSLYPKCCSGSWLVFCRADIPAALWGCRYKPWASMLLCLEQHRSVWLWGRLDIWHILDVNVLGDKALDSLRPLRATVQHHSGSSLGANKERGIVRAGMTQDLELTQTQLRVGLNILFFFQLWDLRCSPTALASVPGPPILCHNHWEQRCQLWAR